MNPRSPESRKTPSDYQGGESRRIRSAAERNGGLPRGLVRAGRAEAVGFGGWGFRGRYPAIAPNFYVLSCSYIKKFIKKLIKNMNG
jgi:hypothetical protein